MRSILKSLCLLGVLMVGMTVGAQNIQVSSAKGQDIETFVLDWLAGNGVYVYNVKFQGTDGTNGFEQMGSFNSNGFLGLQMDSGVVVTTGNCTFAEGPNSSSSGSSGATKTYKDNALTSLATNTITTCGTIDFDFVSISPYITMNYCFGSEEYPEYVCSSFNDIFAFLITGPDPTTGETKTWNCAIIPHTISSTHPDGINVTINSVNSGSVGASGSSTTTGCYLDYSDFYVDNSNGSTSGGGGAKGVQYDAFTQKLSANATLVPCAEYHMHISVCNCGDSGFDSGVFLEKKSFNSPSAEVNLSHRTRDTIERSMPVSLPLTLEGTLYSDGNVDVTFGGTAVVGTDYTVTLDEGTQLGTSVNSFSIGTSGRTLTFKGTPLANLTTPKTIDLYLATALCPDHPELKTNDTIRYLLIEDDLLRLRHDTIVAYDTCYQVGVEVALGTPPFNFHWDPEDDIDFPYQQYSTAHITESRLYKVSASDAKGHTDTTEVYVEIRPKEGIEAPQAVAPSVYPNPSTNGMVSVDMNDVVEVKVYNTLGEEVYATRQKPQGQTLHIRDLATGVYSVSITTAAGSHTEKVIVK